MQIKIVTKIVTVLVLALIFLSFGTASAEIDDEQQELNDDLSYLDIPAPENLEVIKDAEDILVQWDAVEDVDQYKLYYSTDLYTTFPMEWEYVLLEEKQWIHNDVLNSNESYYYLVRGVRNEIEGRISDTGLCERLNLTYDSDGTLHYISIPDGFNNLEEPTASDVVEHIEGDLQTSDYIDAVVKWDYIERRYTETYTYDGISGSWGGTDFLIEPEATVGLALRNNMTCHVNAVESEIPMDFDYDPDERSLHYISVPYTMADLNEDKNLTASDIVLDIEGDLGSSEYIDSVIKWDHTTRGYTEMLEYDAIGETWIGEDFLVEPEAAVGLELCDNLTWKPTLMEFEPPTVISADLEENIVLEFSKDMNHTSVNSNLHSSNFNFTNNWINNYTLEIIPDNPFEPEFEYSLTLNNRSKCIYGNYLDGNSNGTAYRTDGDDYTLNFGTETYPMIEHDSPETWHIRDDIELSANITDDEGLENAYINYTQVDGIQHNVSLDVDNSTISIPAQNQTGTFSYYYWAVDESGLSNRSETFSIELLDLDDPYVMNVSQDSDVLSIYGNFTLEFSKPMNGTSVEDGLVITPDLNYDLTQIDEYRFEVNITAVPNQQYSINLDSQVVEDELGINLDSDFNTTFNTETSPDIVYEQEVFSIHKDSNISFSVECVDDFGVDNVQIEGTGPNGYTFAENLSDTGETWNIVLPRSNRTGQLDYRFIAEDSSGLLTYSENYSISILNPTEIRFKNVTGETDESFEFEIEITNPLGISDVELHYKENGMETVEDLTLTEGNAGDGLWTTQLELDSEGEYEYSVVVTDLDGESVIEHSNKNIAVQESQSIFSNPFLYLLLIIVIAASTGGILYNRRDIGENIHEEETTSEQTEEESEDETEDTDKNLCTICFGEIEENIHICECGKKYHRSCINAIGECPICGNDNLKEGVENGGK